MKNKVVVITGAYGGLGTALSNLLAQKGYSLILSGRNKEKLEKLANEINKLTKTEIVVADLRNKKECEKIINVAIEKFGRIDLLINNAGIWKMSDIDNVTEEDIKEMFEINIFAAIYCSRAAIRIMRKQKSGHILNIGSTAAVDYKTSHIAYGSSKSALIGFTGCLKKELEETGIRVSVFSPGGMKTKLFRTKPERVREDFMEPDFVAQKIFEHIENPNDEWHLILRRPKIS